MIDIRAISFGILAVLSVFFFPWPCTVAIALVGGYFFPPIALIAGVLLDVVYSTGHTIPYFSIFGILATFILFFVQQFVKTRIMS